MHLLHIQKIKLNDDRVHFVSVLSVHVHFEKLPMGLRLLMQNYAAVFFCCISLIFAAQFRIVLQSSTKFCIVLHKGFAISCIESGSPIHSYVYAELLCYFFPCYKLHRKWILCRTYAELCRTMQNLCRTMQNHAAYAAKIRLVQQKNTPLHNFA